MHPAVPPKTVSSEALEAARQNPAVSLRRGQGSALQAIALNSAIGGAKLAAGILGHSYALLADAAESFTDVLSSSISLFGLRVAAVPADRSHPIGHGRAETLASAAVALAIMAAGGLIFWHAMLSLGERRPAPDPRTLLVLVPIILAKEWMFHRLRARGKAIGSVAVVTEAWHQRGDVVTSIAAFIGIVAAWIGGPAGAMPTAGPPWSPASGWSASASGCSIPRCMS